MLVGVRGEEGQGQLGPFNRTSRFCFSQGTLKLAGPSPSGTQPRSRTTPTLVAFIRPALSTVRMGVGPSPSSMEEWGRVEEEPHPEDKGSGAYGW